MPGSKDDAQANMGPAHVPFDEGEGGLTPDIYQRLTKHIWERRIVGGSEDIEETMKKAKANSKS